VLGKEVTMSPLRRQGSRTSLKVVGGRESFWMPACAGMTGSLPGRAGMTGAWPAWAGSRGLWPGCMGVECGAGQGSDDVTPAKAGVQSEPGGRRRPRVLLDACLRRHDRVVAGACRHDRSVARVRVRHAVVIGGPGFKVLGLRLRVLGFFGGSIHQGHVSVLRIPCLTDGHIAGRIRGMRRSSARR